LETAPVTGEAELTAGLAAQAELVAGGGVSARELVAHALRRIEESQPTLNAFRLVREQAAEEATAADKAVADGERAPLLGVPVAIKDDTDIAGMPTAFGCRGEFPVCREDAEIVRRLRAAGAIIVGKTNTPEFGQWPFTEGAAFGDTRNPWQLDHSPGGSSGGSAAAVAAGLVPAAVGSDGAGSIRIPAAWTHLVGIKPQRGRISSWPHAEAFYGITTHGPLARTVADAALLLDVLSGNHEKDRHRAAPIDARAAAETESRPLRIALSYRPAFSGAPVTVDPVVRAAVDRIAGVLDDLGHRVEPAEPRYGLVGLGFLPRSLVGVRDWANGVPDASLLDPRSRQNARTGSLIGAPGIRLARAAAGRLAARVGAIFQRYDVVLTPTTAQPPPRIGTMARLSGMATDRAMVQACPFSWPWNVLGWPGVSVPAGLTGDGLPLGAQLLGPEGGEPSLISLAAQLETAERWQNRWPGHVSG
jgi:amidase